MSNTAFAAHWCWAFRQPKTSAGTACSSSAARGTAHGCVRRAGKMRPTRQWARVSLLLIRVVLQVALECSALECFVEVRAEVFDSLEPDRDAQEAWVRTGLRRYRPVGQGRGVLDQGLGAPQRDRMADELAGIGHGGRGRHLATEDVVGVASGQAWIV